MSHFVPQMHGGYSTLKPRQLEFLKKKLENQTNRKKNLGVLPDKLAFFENLEKK